LVSHDAVVDATNLGPGPLDPRDRETGRELARRQLEAGIAHLRASDRVLAELIDAQPTFDPRSWLAAFPPMDAFGTLLFQIAGQQLSVAATRRILGRIEDTFCGALPTPKQLVGVPPEVLRSAGLSGRKVTTMRAIAAEFESGRLSDALLAASSDEEIERRLTEIPGVGPWTVHGFLIIALDRPDVVLPGDLALRKAIGRCYRLDHLPTQAEVVQIAEPWRPYRSLASAYLFQAGLGPP
jgi:DNA-3-methyladenine glycosylase II